jgi:tRNA(Ile)-lysidine synthase
MRVRVKDPGMDLKDRIPWFREVSRRKRWLVGVSGGADSVALLHLMVEAGFRDGVVCHLDHGLRGRASAEDAKFVRRMAMGLGLECEVGRVDVAARMVARQESMETAARHARHRFFVECGKKHRCYRVVLAHHADDQAETVLWNLLRGSHGLKGMSLVQPLVVENGEKLEIHRPLLDLRHDELVGWLKDRRCRWREDGSNRQPVAIRNRLRNEVFPLLDEISGRDAAMALVRGAADHDEMREVEAWAVGQANALDPQGRLHLPVLRELPPALQRAVVAWFLQRSGVLGPDRCLLGRALELLDPEASPAVNLPGGGWLRRRSGRLSIEGRSGT